MPIPLAGLLGLLGGTGARVGAGIAARQAAKKTAEIGLRSASMARGVQPMTKGATAMGAAGAASAGLSAMDGVRAGANGDVAGAAVGGLGMLPGASMARNAGRAGLSALSAVGAPAFAAADAVNRTGMMGVAPSEATTPPVVQQPVTPQQPQNTQDGQPTATTADIAAEAEARRQAAAATRLDAGRTSNINGFGARAGQNYQEITADLRNMAKQGVREWQPRDLGMTEWEADNRRREIRMAYSNHPIPGKGESKVMQFDQDLQKRREAIENARVAGFNANTGAFDKALSALGQANTQSVDMADKMFSQTAMRRGQDIAAQKNLWDAQASDKTATAQLFTALGGLGGGAGAGAGAGGSGDKGATNLVDLVKKTGEVLYPDDKFDIKKRAGLANILTNAEDVQALQTLIENGGEAAGLEYLAANQGDNVRSNSLADLGVGGALKGGPLDGAWAHVKDVFGGAPHKLGNSMYEVDGEMIDEVDYRKRIGKATSDLIRNAVNSPGASPGKDASGADIMSFNEFQEAGGDFNGYNSYLKSVSASYLQDQAAFPKK